MHVRLRILEAIVESQVYACREIRSDEISRFDRMKNFRLHSVTALESIWQNIDTVVSKFDIPCAFTDKHEKTKECANLISLENTA